MDLDIAGVDDEHEEGVGQVVVLNFDDNAAPRKEVILRKVMPNDWTGNVILSRSAGNVEIFESATGGTEMNFDGIENKFANSALPKSLWVEGNIASTIMRDVKLKLEAEDISDCDDKVSFTVLWVNLSTDHTGSVNEDNFAIITYEDTVLPQGDNTLGHHLFYFEPAYGDRAGYLRASEFLGHLTVLDFDPSQFTSDSEALDITREVVDGNRFWGMGGNEYVDPAVPGDDTSDPLQRDDIPLSGGSPSVIYDWDAPGLIKWSAPMYMIIRMRTNFRQWAVWKDPASSEQVRCSQKISWFSRQSYIKTDDSDVGWLESTSSNTLTDNDKNWDVNHWKPGIVRIAGGNAAGQIRRIAGNTAKVITVEPQWDPQPNEGSMYEVINESSWVPSTDVAEDNINADGTTSITWNLE